MVSWLLLLGMVAAAADSAPEFTAAGVAARTVVPGTFLTIYGSNLGPRPGECTATLAASSWPREFCGAQVLIRNFPTELLYVSEKQINLKVPQDSPQSGMVDIRVVYNGQSSRRVAMKAGVEPTTVSLDSPAYVDMPVWLKIGGAGAVLYPFIVGPAGFGCNQVEVRRNGQMLPVLPGSNWGRYGIVIAGNICGSYSPSGDSQTDRLPLHLLYRFDVPGLYDVRYALRRGPAGVGIPQTDIRARSEWTPIEVLAARPGQRSEWLRSLRQTRGPSDAVTRYLAWTAATKK